MKKQQSTKRKIAKEIIIFFCFATLIGLVWTTFWIISQFHIHKTENLQEQIVSSNRRIDSIQATFPKLRSFHNLFNKDNVPKHYWLIKKDIPNIEEISGPEQERKRAKNIRRLYSFLELSKYQFDTDHSIPDFRKFYDEIVKELESDPIKQQTLDKIYSFLKEQKYLTAEFEEFRFTLDALQPPPKYDTLTAYQDEIKKQDNSKKDLEIYKAKLNSTVELGIIAKWTSIIVLIIVYPFRFLMLLLFWSIRTLRQK
jgi:cell division protein FtsB